MSLEVEIRAPTPEESATAAKWPIWTKEESEFELQSDRAVPHFRGRSRHRC